MLVQDMKQRVVLGGGNRHFEDVTDKIRHHGAAAAPLRVKGYDIAERHVVGEVKIPVPLRLTIKSGRSVAFCPILPAITIDQGDPAKELISLIEQPAIVVEILHAHFKSAPAQSVQKFRSDGVSLFGDDLKGG